jgi:branched-subunit amino acid transport protein
VSGAYLWTVILVLGLVTYLIRFSFLGLFAGREPPEAVRRALAYVPSAVLPALAAPMVALDPAGGPAAPSLWLAALAALALGAATGRMGLSVLAGFAALHGLRALGL